MRDRTPDANDRLTWKWLDGQATSLADFGDPLASTSYQLCVYDGAGNTVARASAPPGGMCDGRPCWRVRGTKVVYKSPERNPGGGRRSTVRLTLRAGGDGKARIMAQGRGVHLDIDPLPWSQPVTVQLKTSEGTCWEAAYSVPARRDEAGRFQDKSD